MNESISSALTNNQGKTYATQTSIGWSVDNGLFLERKPPKQLLKWIGNKQRFAEQICKIFPVKYNRYIEPFVGSGAILGAMAPKKGIAGDILKPLVEMWSLLQAKPETLLNYYKRTWEDFTEDRYAVYRQVLDSYNQNPNPLDLLFLSRSCYGGVIRFTKQGKMSTPIGAHRPIPPESFKERLYLWKDRVKDTKFVCASYQETMEQAGKGDVIYCDPPYIDSQTILYGAQAFKFENLLRQIELSKRRGAKIALSIDGKKKSGSKVIGMNIPEGIFEREILIAGGSSMLKRFQKKDQIMSGEDVHDRLLLTW